MITRELMMVKIRAGRIVLPPNVKDRDLRVGQILFRGVTAKNRYRMIFQKDGTGKQIVFVGSSGVSENG
jgi:hypothetical protein